MARTVKSRVAVAVTAGGAALALTACGSDGVLTDGSTAATYGSYSVSTDEVQQAVSDVKPLDQQGIFTNQSVSVLLALNPEINKLAARFGAAISPSQLKSGTAPDLPDGHTLSEPAVTALQTHFQLQAIASKGRPGAAAVNTFLKNADITLNPRYGQFDKGSITPAATNWIKPAPAGAQPEAHSPDDGHNH